MLVNSAKLVPFTSNYWKEQLKNYLKSDFKNKSLLLPSRLEFKPILKSELKEMPYVIAIDTETFATNGNLICLCNSENNNVLYGTVDKQPTIEDYFNYLSELQNHKRNVCFFAYNLKFDASIILKSLNIDVEKFYEEEFELYFEEYDLKVKYLNKKCLTLTRDKTNVNIFDALQYFIGAGENGSSSLDAVAKAYLGEQKKYEGKYKNKVFPDDIETEELIEIVKYCIKDCDLTKKLMDIWIEAFKNNFGFYPTKFYSAGFISVLVLKTTLNEFPTFRFIPYAVQDLAYRSYFGGRFEITSRGYMENIYHYDIKSAYPHAMAELPDFKRGKWKKINTLREFIENKNNVGFYKILVDVNEKSIAPFMFRDDAGQVTNPRGTFITNVTGYELAKAVDYYDIKIKNMIGFCFIPDNQDETEFNKLIKQMYDTRMKQTNEGQKYVYKVIINSIYGKTAQSRPEPKGLFNPVLCASITGHTRARLLDIAKDNKDDIIMFATDGIFSRKKLNLPLGKKLGEFDFEFHPKFILLMAGIYSYNTEKKSELKPKSRGFSLRIFEGEGEKRKEKSFDFDEYSIKEDNGEYFYEIINIRPLSIAKSVIEHKYDPSQIGKMIDIKKKIDLNGDHKRLWKKQLRSIYDYSDSITIKLL